MVAIFLWNIKIVTAKACVPIFPAILKLVAEKEQSAITSIIVASKIDKKLAMIRLEPQLKVAKKSLFWTR